MITILLLIGTVLFMGKVLVWGIKAAWGAAKLVLFILGLPFILCALVLGGLVGIALPVLGIALLAAFLLPAVF